MARGSLPGERRGGRQKGAKNKKTEIRKQLVEDALADGLQPIHYLLKIMRGEETADKDKLAAAIAAAPYIHPRLSAIEANVSASVKHDIDDFTSDELLSIARGGRGGESLRSAMASESRKGKAEPH